MIETKNVSGAVQVRRGQLLVAGRRKQAFVEQAWREAAAVQGVLSGVIARAGIEVRPLLCFPRARLPWGKTVVAGVPILSCKATRKMILRAPCRLDAAQVRDIAAFIERNLPPA